METVNLDEKKKGKRECLNNKLTRELMKKLEIVFETTVKVPRIKIGKKQTIETLISEEALLLAKYLRDEIKKWIPRIDSTESFAEIITERKIFDEFPT